MNRIGKAGQVILLAIIITVTQQVAIEGSWTLEIVNGRNLSIPVKIESYVFRKTEIMQKITFDGCSSIMYQMYVQNNNIFLNLNTEYIISESLCSQGQERELVLIRQAIRRVFTFQIQVNKLVFQNPFNRQIFLFSRNKEQPAKNVSIKGSWQITFPQINTINFLLIANETHFSTCNETLYKYTMKSPYHIDISLVDKDRCSHPFVNQVLARAQYYRMSDKEIKIYNKEADSILEGQLRSNVKRQLRTPVAEPIVEIQQVKQLFKDGSYIVLLLFRRDLARIRVKITNSTLQLMLCSKLLFKIQELEGKKIKISSQSTPDASCKRNEQLYYNTLTEARSYNIIQSGSIILLDQAGRQIINFSN